MEHPDLPTLHYDDVPRSFAGQIITLSDLTLSFGPLGESFMQSNLEWVATTFFQMPPSAHPQMQDEEHVLKFILCRAAQNQSHLLMVIQIHPNPLEGFVCLMPHTKFQWVQEVLNQVSDRQRS